MTGANTVTHSVRPEPGPGRGWPAAGAGGAVPARRENDFGGEVHVPGEALWGAQTQRALDAFTISDLRLPRSYLGALGSLKRAAARANTDLGRLDPALTAVIIAAAGEVADGDLDDHFRVDVFQTGSGTNTNFAHAGAHVVVSDLDIQNAEKVAADLPSAVTVCTDVRTPRWPS